MMIETSEHEVSMQALRGKLAAVYAYLIERKDQAAALKVKELAQKLVEEEFAIAFCGHFSAGKSRMINSLVGGNLLPSSPIPTSANLVKVKGGEEYAKVFFKNDKPRLYRAPYDYNLVKNYCRDGDQIESIEISHADLKLPPRTVILDTPGIDSADDAHRIATESAIHLADLIFYVMDYNHVQSELNFMFTKELTEAGKEVYLVVNQVDKHTAQELSFADFKRSVTESFASWGVRTADVFYTSLKEAGHEHNEFPRLRRFLSERLKLKDTLLPRSIFHSLQKVVSEHLESVKRENHVRLQPAWNLCGELPPKERDALLETHASLRAEQTLLRDCAERTESEFDSGTKKILDSAYLMPYSTRAFAEAYLEACQPDFKVGFLFRKKKTEEERKSRLAAFYEDILEKTKSQLEWQLRSFLSKFIEERRIEDAALTAKIQAFEIEFTNDLLLASVKEGARLSGEYVLNYTASVANDIKRIAQSFLSSVKGDLLSLQGQKNTALEEKIAGRLQEYSRYVTAIEEIKTAQEWELAEAKRLEALMDEAGEMEAEQLGLFALAEEAFDIVEGGYKEKRQEQAEVEQKTEEPVLEKVPLLPEAEDKLKRTAKRLELTAKIIKDMPGFEKLADELSQKAERLNHKGFTVALFGAFSAGKSSFANALIGNGVLPVSPNPTTAAINRIKPIDAQHSHGTVHIKLKEEAALLEDVQRALHVFDLKAGCLAEAAAIAAKMDEKQESQGAVEKTNCAFLQAFRRGYDSFGSRLGQVLEATLDAFKDYVAKEEKSCFVEWIDLYYDCELTRKGISLVDTPGADSINARHTGVAFDFIRNSDAVLFVTYYNHAFSKADREFLIQLGRVKDSFQLDKMFFIINAIDLAENEAEKEAVTAYVREQLLKYGVRNPHLYALSSLKALREKLNRKVADHSGMAEFEEAFYHFITGDLASMAAKASESELKRVRLMVEKLIDNAKGDVAEKEAKRIGIEKEKERLRSVFARQMPQNIKSRLRQEVEELMYYTKQRVFLRFNEFFKESFHPSVLRDDGRDLKKAINNALDEFLAQLGFDFAQEMRAMTVRLDRFAEKTVAEYQSALMDTLYEINGDISFSLYEYGEKAQIEFKAAFEDLPRTLFANATAHFKNPRSFFEKQENSLMREELRRVLDSEADAYLSEQQGRMRDAYEQIADSVFYDLSTQMQQQSSDFYMSLLTALEGGIPVEELKDLQRKIQAVAG